MSVVIETYQQQEQSVYFGNLPLKLQATLESLVRKDWVGIWHDRITLNESRKVQLNHSRQRHNILNYQADPQLTDGEKAVLALVRKGAVRGGWRTVYPPTRLSVILREWRD